MASKDTIQIEMTYTANEDISQNIHNVVTKQIQINHNSTQM